MFYVLSVQGARRGYWPSVFLILLLFILFGPYFRIPFLILFNSPDNPIIKHIKLVAITYMEDEKSF